MNYSYIFYIQWIGLRENLQENPIFHGKIYGFLMFPVDFPLNQSIDIYIYTYPPTKRLRHQVKRSPLTRADRWVLILIPLLLGKKENHNIIIIHGCYEVIMFNMSNNFIYSKYVFGFRKIYSWMSGSWIFPIQGAPKKNQVLVLNLGPPS